MCGPADYEALYTCAERLAALSAAGLSTYALGQFAEVVRKTRQRSNARKLKSKKDQARIPVREGFVAADR
jgi:hypothetical protein